MHVHKPPMPGWRPPGRKTQAPPPPPPSGPEAALEKQKQTDKEQEAMTEASNLQKKCHDTIMAIIANIK